jgi:Flp pilus assembly protein TadD
MTRMTLQQAFETAVSRFRSGRADEAEAICRQILAVERNDAALHLLGLLAGHAGRAGEAVELIAQAISVNPSIAVYHNNLGEGYRRLGKPEQAAAAYQKAVELQPGFALAWRNLGGVLLVLGRTSDAVAACKAAVAIEPGSAEARDNLGAAHAADGDPEAAAVAAAAAIGLGPGLATAHGNLGAALLKLGRPTEAVASLRTAIQLQPNLSKAHWNLGLALLVLGDWEGGWPEYEWRWKCDALGVSRGFAQFLWGGEPLAGRTVLLHAEQGMGDVLQFVRYAPLVAARGGRVVLECHPELCRLLRSAPGIAELIPGGHPLPPFDVHCPLLSIPGVVGTRPNSVPAGVPYLAADPPLVESWTMRIAEQDTRLGRAGLRVGLAWAGSPAHQNDRNRSITLGQLAPLAGAAGVRFYSLQRGPAADQAAHPPAGMDLVDWSADFRDMADTAALVSCLDLVITVDTAVAHLAGALGKPVWTLLPHAPDWRWMLERSDSPWYPTMRLFRQPRRGDWESAIRHVAVSVLNYPGG